MAIIFCNSVTSFNKGFEMYFLINIAIKKASPIPTISNAIPSLKTSIFILFNSDNSKRIQTYPKVSFPFLILLYTNRLSFVNVKVFSFALGTVNRKLGSVPVLVYVAKTFLSLSRIEALTMSFCTAN